MYASLVRPSSGPNLFSLKHFLVASPSSTSCDTVGWARVGSLLSVMSNRTIRSNGSPTALAAAWPTFRFHGCKTSNFAFVILSWYSRSPIVYAGLDALD